METPDGGAGERETAIAADDLCYRWNPRVACRQLDGVAFILLGGRMISLNPVGSAIWACLEQGASVEAAARRVVDVYDTTWERALADTRRFVADLAERGMLLPVEP